MKNGKFIEVSVYEAKKMLKEFRELTQLIEYYINNGIKKACSNDKKLR